MIITHDKTVVFYKTVIRVYDTYNEASTKQKQKNGCFEKHFTQHFFKEKFFRKHERSDDNEKERKTGKGDADVLLYVYAEDEYAYV